MLPPFKTAYCTVIACPYHRTHLKAAEGVLVLKFPNVSTCVEIVGVGAADYRSMEALDGDDVRLVNRAGKPASRDIVQFVPMRDFSGKSPHALAKEVLAEIPGQVIDYMKANNIPPGDPVRARNARAGSVGANVVRGSMHQMGAPAPQQTYADPPPAYTYS